MGIYAQIFSPYSQKYLRVLTEVFTRKYECVCVYLLICLLVQQIDCVLRWPDGLLVFNFEVIKDCFIVVLCCEASV